MADQGLAAKLACSGDSHIRKGGIDMMISGISSANAPAGPVGMSQASDPVSKDLLRQIDDAKKKLQELSSNGDLSMEEKMKKRQELQKQISDLNSQLRQHQMELRREAAEKSQKQKEQNSGPEDLGGNSPKTKDAGKGKQAAGLSTGSMQAMLSADGTMKQAEVHGSVAQRMEGKAGVLEAEIKLDAGRGGSTEAKEKELAEVKDIAANAAASQMDTLSEANEELEKAGKERTEETKPTKIGTSDSGEPELKDKPGEDQEESGQTGEENKLIRYKPVDIRL